MTVQVDVNKAVIVGSVVSLGNEKDPFHFFSVEVPAQLPLGREKTLAIHKFHGGGRAIDDYGDHPDALEFSGTLLSIGDIPKAGERPALKAQLAINRSETLDRLCRLRTPIKFKFHTYEYIGVVAKYKPVILHHNQVNYTIRFEILSEVLKPQSDFLFATVGVQPGLPPLAKMLQQYNKVAKALTFVLRTAAGSQRLAEEVIEQLQTDPGGLLFRGAHMVPGAAITVDVMRAAKEYVEAIGAIRTTEGPQFLLDMEAAKPYETLAPEAFTKYLIPQTTKLKARFEAVLTWMCDYQNLLGSSNPGNTAQAVTYYANVKNGLGILLKQMNKVVAPADVPTITVTNPDLYALAVQYYDDIESWRIIAKANNLTTPRLLGSYTLKIPPRDTASQGASTLTSSVGNG